MALYWGVVDGGGGGELFTGGGGGGGTERPMLLERGRLLEVVVVVGLVGRGVLRTGLAFLRGAVVDLVLGWAALLAQGGADSNCEILDRYIYTYINI